MIELLVVDKIDYTLTDGKYKKEYWGKIVVDNTGVWMVVDEKGEIGSITGDWWIDLFKQFEKKKERKKVKVDVSDLLKLKEKFTVDEIIKLRNEGLV
ncbi:hypothetical protein J7K25_07560 [bacterium]|nr:hypothetical protein [bacterium]